MQVERSSLPVMARVNELLTRHHLVAGLVNRNPAALFTSLAVSFNYIQSLDVHLNDEHLNKHGEHHSLIHLNLFEFHHQLSN